MLFDSPALLLTTVAVAALSLLNVIGAEVARRQRVVDLRFRVAKREREIDAALKAKRKPKDKAAAKAA